MTENKETQHSTREALAEHLIDGPVGEMMDWLGTGSSYPTREEMLRDTRKWADGILAHLNTQETPRVITNTGDLVGHGAPYTLVYPDGSRVMVECHTASDNQKDFKNHVLDFSLWAGGDNLKNSGIIVLEGHVPGVSPVEMTAEDMDKIASEAFPLTGYSSRMDAHDKQEVFKAGLRAAIERGVSAEDGTLREEYTANRKYAVKAERALLEIWRGLGNEDRDDMHFGADPQVVADEWVEYESRKGYVLTNDEAAVRDRHLIKLALMKAMDGLESIDAHAVASDIVAQGFTMNPTPDRVPGLVRRYVVFYTNGEYPESPLEAKSDAEAQKKFKKSAGDYAELLAHWVQERREVLTPSYMSRYEKK